MLAHVTLVESATRMLTNTRVSSATYLCQTLPRGNVWLKMDPADGGCLKKRKTLTLCRKLKFAERTSNEVCFSDDPC